MLSPLDVVALPSVEVPGNAFSKMHTYVSERQRKKEQESLLKGRKKAQKQWYSSQEASNEYEAKMVSLAAKEEAVRHKAGRRASQELRELERKRESAAKQHKKDVEKTARRRRRTDKEEGSMRRILFLIVTPKSRYS